MRATLTVLFGMLLIVLVVGGSIKNFIFGAPKSEEPEIGANCGLPFDWRYARLDDGVAVAGP